jgi:hypothetical protein
MSDGPSGRAVLALQADYTMGFIRTIDLTDTNMYRHAHGIVTAQSHIRRNEARKGDDDDR